jgi:ABC-type Mn2+/Zn2+ transport system ATPase subunit
MDFCPAGYFPVGGANATCCECERDGAYWAKEEHFYMMRNIIVLGIVPVIFYLFQKGLLFNLKPVDVADRFTHTMEQAFGSAQVTIDGVSRSTSSGVARSYAAVNVKFNKLALEVKGRTVLNGLSGEIKSSSMVAIMGPSGAGKSTFLSVLCGRAFDGTVHGETFINGCRAKITDHRDRLGFVPQDDIIHDDLTVRENLWYSALLRMSGKSRIDEKRDIVDEALRDLHLEKIANSIVGSVASRGISGGERKRVNIGLELCADPRLLFLDEPTSGLDSTSSERVVKALKQMTRSKCMTVWCVHVLSICFVPMCIPYMYAQTA